MEKTKSPPVSEISTQNKTSLAQDEETPYHSSTLSNSIPNVLKKSSDKPIDEAINKQREKESTKDEYHYDREKYPELEKDKDHDDKESTESDKLMENNKQYLPLEFAYAIPIVAMLMIIGLWLMGYYLSYGAFSILLGSVILSMYAWYKRTK